MARTPKLNWTSSRAQYTVTFDGKFHLLGADKEEAEKKYRWLLQQKNLGGSLDTNPQFAEIADLWLEHAMNNHCAKRYSVSKRIITDFVLFFGETKRINDLRPIVIEDWIVNKSNVTKPGSQRQYKAVILACLNWAASRKVRLIPHNPIKGLIELPEGGSRGGDAVWTDKTYNMVIKYSNPAFADVVKILLMTGARPITICKVESIHYQKELKLWDFTSEKSKISNNRKNVRRIWLSPDAIDLVEELNKRHPEGPIFRNSNNEPWTPDSLGVYFYNLRYKFLATRNLEWQKGISLYGLRHTFATNFIKKQPSRLEFLREMMGHKDLEMIRKHYGHLFDEHEAMHEVLKTLKPF